MSSWWKKTRRRAKQKFMESTGACDAVVDEEWEGIWEEYQKDIAAMKVLEKRLSAMSPIHKKWTKKLQEEMEGFKEYFSSREAPEDLRKSSNAASDASDKLKRAVWPNVEEAYTRGVLEPLRQIFDVEHPEIKSNAAKRGNVLTDVNSYRRKLQKLLSNEKADPERKLVVKAKLDKAVARFEALDLQLKTQLKKFHAERFERVRGFAQLAMFCQLDVFSRAASMLAVATDPLPQAARDAALQSLGHMHSTKGVRPGSKSQSFSSDKKKNSWVSSPTTTGNHSRMSSMDSNAPPTPSVLPENVADDSADDLMNLSIQSPAVMTSSTTTTTTNVGTKDETEEDQSSVEEYVIADFDFTSDDAGDLPFFKGDRIGVLEKGGGWWKGTIGGKIGMFPANYTHKE